MPSVESGKPTRQFTHRRGNDIFIDGTFSFIGDHRDFESRGRGDASVVWKGAQA
jgi:hypothetical protein